MKKILVTGGVGFMGSNFIRFILKKYPDYQVINLDKLTYAGNLNNLLEVAKNPRYKFIKGDICDSDLVNQVVKNVDVIINYAAETHVDRSIRDPGAFIKTNVYGVYVLLEAAKKYQIKRFVQISADEVYGSIKKGAFFETSSLSPNNPYSASKAAADLLVRSYFVTYNLPGLITRSCNNYGPYQYPEKLIPLFITNLLKNKKVPLYGDGKNIREWIYVEDHARAIDLILHKGKVGEIYNIGSGERKSNLELTKEVLKALNLKVKMIQPVADRPGHDFRYALDSSKLRTLGFSPRFSFRAGLPKTIDWYIQNTQWWRPLKKKTERFYQNL